MNKTIRENEDVNSLNITNISVFDIELLKFLKLDSSQDLRCEKIEEGTLKAYTYFRNLSIIDIETARWNLYNEKNLNVEWSESILRFLEIRQNDLDNRISKMFNTRIEANYFKQILVSLLLEYCYYTGDKRFLNIAFKLLKKLIRSKGKGYVKAQYSYNLIMASKLLSKMKLLNE